MESNEFLELKFLPAEDKTSLKNQDISAISRSTDITGVVKCKKIMLYDTSIARFFVKSQAFQPCVFGSL